MDSRLCFIASCVRGDDLMSVLCRRHGISRKTGYKWLGRYRAYGAAGLADHFSARLTHPPSSAAPEVAAAILALRDHGQGILRATIDRRSSRHRKTPLGRGVGMVRCESILRSDIPLLRFVHISKVPRQGKLTRRQSTFTKLWVD
jgi:transposase-like protein